MRKFISREKLSKKARRLHDAEKRATWAFSPVTRKAENKKHYDRRLCGFSYHEEGRERLEDHCQDSYWDVKLSETFVFLKSAVGRL